MPKQEPNPPGLSVPASVVKLVIAIISLETAAIASTELDTVAVQPRLARERRLAGSTQQTAGVQHTRNWAADLLHKLRHRTAGAEHTAPRERRTYLCYFINTNSLTK